MTEEEIIQKRDELQKEIDGYKSVQLEICSQFFGGDLERDDFNEKMAKLNTKIAIAQSSINSLASMINACQPVLVPQGKK